MSDKHKKYLITFNLFDGTVRTVPIDIPLGEPGGYYKPVVKQISDEEIEVSYVPSNPEMPPIDPVQVTLPAGTGSGGNADQTSVEPAENDMPKVFLTGSEFGNMTTAKNEVNMGMEYISKAEKFKAAIKIKFQGNTSLSFPKKNFTIKMYTDDSYEDKLKKNFKDWNHSGNKYVLKANWIDHAHARNIISARLWGEVVASRPDYDSLPVEMRNAPNNGAIDGFPVKLYVNGNYEGVYTWNVGKDDWMWGMDEDNANHVLMCAETNTDGAYKETPCNFRALWNGVDESNWTVEVGTNSTAVKTALNNLIQFVMDNDGDAFRNGIGNYLDIQSAIDYYIFQYEICGLDGLAKNMLLATYDGKKWICGAYDMDATFGLWWNGTKFVSATFACPEDYQERYSLLWERIEANFLPDLKARQAELRKTVLSYSNIVTHFERFMDVIGLDLYAEDLTIYTGIPSGSTNNIKQIRNFIRDRQAYVDAEFANMGEGGEEEPDEPDVPETVPCTGITLSTSTLTFTGSENQTLVATVEPTNTTDTVVWSVSPVGIVTVSNGVVTPLTRGSCVITATCGEQSATCSVAVDIDVTTWMENADIDRETGEVITGDSYISSFIPVETNHRYQFTNPTNGNYGRVAGYTEDGVLVKYYGEVTGPGILAFDAIGGVKKVRLGVYGSSADLNGAVNNLVNLGIWSGGGYEIDSATGEIVASQYNTNRVTMEKIPVEAGATYRISNINSGAAKYMLFAEYDANGEFIRASAESGNSTNPFEQTMTADTAFIMAKVSSSIEVNGNIEISKV